MVLQKTSSWYITVLAIMDGIPRFLQFLEYYIIINRLIVLLAYMSGYHSLKLIFYALSTINNFKSTGRYGYEKPKGRTESTIKRMDDAIILSAKKSSIKTSKAIHAALPQDTVTASALPSQRTIRRRLFRTNLKSCKPAKKPKLSLKNIADRLAFCNRYQAWTPEQWCFQMNFKYPSFMLFADTFDILLTKETHLDTSFPQ